MGAANALLLKINQIGTLSEAFDAASMASRNGYTVVVSHRSAETEDTTISDISVAIGAEMIKDRSPGSWRKDCKIQPAPQNRGRTGVMLHTTCRYNFFIFSFLLLFTFLTFYFFYLL